MRVTDPAASLHPLAAEFLTHPHTPLASRRGKKKKTKRLNGEDKKKRIHAVGAFLLAVVK